MKIVLLFFVILYANITQMTSKIDNSSDCRVLLSRRIIDKATEMFLSKGIKAVKMDDVANELAISKRTLYEIFSNKELLLLHCVQRMREVREEHFKRFEESGPHSEIAMILEYYRFQLRRSAVVSPNFIKELQKYPAVVKWMEESLESAKNEAKSFFEKGIENGYFRKDVNYALIHEYSDIAIADAMEKGLMDKYGVQEVFKNITMLYVRGFCTLKGIEELEKLL
jgi:AcrR family transcriptional regulator